MRRTTGAILIETRPRQDQQVGLARRGAEGLEAEARDVDARGDDRHHLDRAAGEAERRREQRVAARPVDGLVERRREHALLDVLLELARPRGRRAACRGRAAGGCGSRRRTVAEVRAERGSFWRFTSIRAHLGARRRRTPTSSSAMKTIDLDQRERPERLAAGSRPGRGR